MSKSDGFDADIEIDYFGLLKDRDLHNLFKFNDVGFLESYNDLLIYVLWARWFV